MSGVWYSYSDRADSIYMVIYRGGPQGRITKYVAHKFWLYQDVKRSSIYISGIVVYSVCYLWET
jgi:hypothetical protein